MNAAPEQTLTDAYRLCAQQVRRSAANFYYAFMLLPGPKRRALHAVYGFCRGADDIADGPGSAEERRALLEDYRQSLLEALAGRPRGSDWLVLADSAKRFELDPANLSEVIDGCAADCAPLEVNTEADLQRYSYGVAGSVGLLSARIFGYRDLAVPGYAVELGEAMQLTNILRDLTEDLGNGRCYLPAEDLARFGVSREDLLVGPLGSRAQRYRDLMRFEVDRARRHFRSGLRLVPLVERDARGCPAALAALYQRLLVEVERRDYDVQSQRISLSKSHKVGLALGAWLRATLRP